MPEYRIRPQPRKGAEQAFRGYVDEIVEKHIPFIGFLSGAAITADKETDERTGNHYIRLISDKSIMPGSSTGNSLTLQEYLVGIKKRYKIVIESI